MQCKRQHVLRRPDRRPLRPPFWREHEWPIVEAACGKMTGPTVRNGLFGQARLLLTASFLGRKLLNQAFRFGRRFV